MKGSLFPIHIWVLRERHLSLLTLCASVEEALECATKLPFTPKVVSRDGALPFDDSLAAEGEFGEAPADDFRQASSAEPESHLL